MRFVYRLPLIIFFILIFIVLTPAVILYGQGYNYDFQHHRLTKTGNFLIDSSPNDALVYINNQLQIPKWYHKLLFYKEFLKLTRVQSTTPTTISNLLPDKYLVGIKKPGYFQWQKHLTIEAEKTTNTGKVYLFLEQPKTELLINEKIDSVYSIGDNKKIFYSVYNSSSKSSTLKLLDLTNQPKTQIYLSNISGHVNKVEDASGYILISVSGAQFIAINQFAPEQIINIHNFVKNPLKVIYTNNLFYAQTNSNIYAFNPISKKSVLIFSSSNNQAASRATRATIQDWLIKDGFLYILIKEPTNTALEKFKLGEAIQNGKPEQPLLTINLPLYDFQFLPNQLDNNLFVLKNDRDIFILDTEQPEHPFIFQNKANEAIFTNNNKNILYYNDFEIFSALAYKDQDGLTKIKNDLIDRESQTITQVVTYPSNAYLFLNHQDYVSALELDDRDIRNIYNLLVDAKIQKIWFADSSRYFYCWGTINNQDGLWQVSIQY